MKLGLQWQRKKMLLDYWTAALTWWLIRGKKYTSSTTAPNGFNGSDMILAKNQNTSEFLLLVERVISNPLTIYQPITVFNLTRHLKNIGDRKTLGPSTTPAWALKDSSNIIRESLQHLINAFNDEGKLPDHPKQAIVIVMFKKSDCEERNVQRRHRCNLLFWKFYRILRKQLKNYIDENISINLSQFDFRSKFSTADAFLITTATTSRQKAQSHCDIFRQRVVGMNDRTCNKWFFFRLRPRRQNSSLYFFVWFFKL